MLTWSFIKPFNSIDKARNGPLVSEGIIIWWNALGNDAITIEHGMADALVLRIRDVKLME